MSSSSIVGNGGVLGTSLSLGSHGSNSTTATSSGSVNELPGTLAALLQLVAQGEASAKLAAEQMAVSKQIVHRLREGEIVGLHVQIAGMSSPTMSKLTTGMLTFSQPTQLFSSAF